MTKHCFWIEFGRYEDGEWKVISLSHTGAMGESIEDSEQKVRKMFENHSSDYKLWYYKPNVKYVKK